MRSTIWRTPESPQGRDLVRPTAHPPGGRPERRGASIVVRRFGNGPVRRDSHLLERRTFPRRTWTTSPRRTPTDLCCAGANRVLSASMS
jgi:hypothetical protein